MRKYFKNGLLYIISTCFLVVLTILLVTACKPEPAIYTGETRLVVSMHDVVSDTFARSIGNGKNLNGIEALRLVVAEMVVFGPSGKTVILAEERVIDILGVSRSDPVVLSNVSIEPGIYNELRLVLKDECTIKINGETYPIKIPSGEQSGPKLKGPFDVTAGKLFSSRTTASSVYLKKNKVVNNRNIESDVHIIRMAFDRYYMNASNRLTAHLKALWPEYDVK